MPANALPEMSSYPRLTVALMIAMGSLLGPLLEQAGFWGYCQGMLEEEFTGPAAIVMSSVLFAILPHPPVNSALWPRLTFYFLAGVTFGMMAWLTNSILPGVLVHIAGDLSFFTLVWPYDAARPLIGEGGPDAWFWIHATQASFSPRWRLWPSSRWRKKCVPGSGHSRLDELERHAFRSAASIPEIRASAACDRARPR